MRLWLIKNEQGNFSRGVGWHLRDRGKDAERSADSGGQLQSAAADQAVGRHGIAHAVGNEPEDQTGHRGYKSGVARKVFGEVLFFHARLPSREPLEGRTDFAIEKRLRGSGRRIERRIAYCVWTFLCDGSRQCGNEHGDRHKSQSGGRAQGMEQGWQKFLSANQSRVT